MSRERSGIATAGFHQIIFICVICGFISFSLSALYGLPAAGGFKKLFMISLRFLRAFLSYVASAK